jgi:addiction module HigA family antidote
MSERLVMKNPAHPGEVLRELCLDPLGLSVTEVAEALGVSRKNLSELLNGHIRVSPEMALRLGMAFNTSAEVWLNMQTAYDLAQARKQSRGLKVKRLTTKAAL